MSGNAKKNYYIIEESLLNASIELLEEMPVRLSHKVIPVIGGLKSCQPVSIEEKKDEPVKE